VEEGNFVVSAAPARRPSAEWKGLCAGLLWQGRRPCPSGVGVGRLERSRPTRIGILDDVSRTQLYTQAMSTDKDPRELQDEILGIAESIPAIAIEARKLHIGFWEKLVILDAGTLALSLTAATAFRGHTVGDGGVGYLFAAWKLLISSIICATVAQWLAATSTQHLPLAIYAKLMADRMDRLQIAGKNIFDGTPADMTRQSKRAAKIDRRLWIFAASAGIIAIFLMIAALVYLSRFGAINLCTFLRP
jgi:hypothetical protein